MAQIEYTKKRKPYRIIKILDLYHFQKRGILWGWNDKYVMSSLHNCKSGYFQEVLREKYPDLDMYEVIKKYVDCSKVKD